MYLTISGRADSIAQLLTVLLIFILVLALALYTTRLIAKYQKGQTAGKNIDVVETCRLSNNKYVQIVRIGDTYVAVAVCRDTVTLLGQVPVEQLDLRKEGGALSFRELLDKARKKDSGGSEGPKEE